VLASATAWRPEDESLLSRLEDEEALVRLFRHYVGSAALPASLPHARAAGLVTYARAQPGGAEAAQAAVAGDASKLAGLVEAGPLRARPAPMLHHMALFFATVARTLEPAAPDGAASAWMRSLAAWLALGEERTYLARLQDAVLGPDARRGKSIEVAIPPERVPLEVIAELGRRGSASARDLDPRGRAALLALTNVRAAARLADISEASTRRAEEEAERRRNAAVDSALGVIAESLDDANVRGELGATGGDVLARALAVWTWSGRDEAVEQFVADRLATIGWELYRARDWAALRRTFDPFRLLIESFAARLENDRSKIAYAAPCAQLFVFLTDLETHRGRKRDLAERAVRLCPTHRNGRLNLAALLCDDALRAMRAMVLFAPKNEVERIEGLLDRAEQLYPQTAELPEARAMLERVRKGLITL